MRKKPLWPAAFLIAAALVVALLGLAAVRLSHQERAVERDRLRERLDNAAARLTREAERALAATAADPAASLTLARENGALRRLAGVPLLWLPAAPPANDPPAAPFAPGEALEFAGRDPARAIAAYRPLLRAPEPRLRAGALLRIARCHRALGQPAEARAAYLQLAALGPTPVAGAPAELVALRELGDQAALRHALLAGRHPIDQPTFDFYADGLDIPAPARAWARAAAGDTANFLTLPGPASRITLVPRDAVQSRLAAALANAPFTWRLAPAPPGPQTRTLRAAETGLPFDLSVTVPASPSAPFPLAALLALGLAILAALYFAYRAVRRELAVAAMQTDFVAAVSHEFRTPITALTHLTDLLASGDAPPGRLPLYYTALAKETRRLHDMVENLLDFGRIEAGRYKYKPEPTDAAAFLSEILDDFRHQPVAAGRDLTCEATPAGLHLDREAMRRAVWNLLDNAAKYSPPGAPIAASVHTRPGWTAIAVADRGSGIPPEDRARIFQKFVRGRDESGKGTGIGLAMADAIVRAHGGRIELVSTPGQGSTFTILLPSDAP